MTKHLLVFHIISIVLASLLLPASDPKAKAYDINCASSLELPSPARARERYQIYCYFPHRIDETGAREWTIPNGTLFPEYPPEMRLRGISGRVIVRYSLKNGQTYNIWIENQSNPVFGAAALAAVHTWSFNEESTDGSDTPVTFDFCFGGGAPRYEGFFSIGVIAQEDVAPASGSYSYPVVQPLIDYPREWRTAGVSGFAEVKILVTPNNNVDSVSVLGASTSAIGELAKERCQKWQFSRELPVKDKKIDELLFRIVLLSDVYSGKQ